MGTSVRVLEAAERRRRIGVAPSSRPGRARGRHPGGRREPDRAARHRPGDRLPRRAGAHPRPRPRGHAGGALRRADGAAHARHAAHGLRRLARLAAHVRAASTDAVAAQQRRRFVGLLEQARHRGGRRRLGARGGGRHGGRARRPRGGRRARVRAGRRRAAPARARARGIGPWAATSRVLLRVLLLAASGRIVRGRPRGGWTSTQYRYATEEGWFGAALPRAEPEPAARRARAPLARRLRPGPGRRPALVDGLERRRS